MPILPIEHLETKPGSGQPRIVGTRFNVSILVATLRNNPTWTVDEAAQRLDLTAGQIYAALSYYADHQAEMDAYVQQAEAKILETGLSSADIHQRMAALREAKPWAVQHMPILPIEHLETKPESGQPRIVGTRFTVYILVATLRNNPAWTVEEAADQLDLTPGQIYAALSYYADHRAEMDAYMQHLEAQARAVGTPIDDQIRERMAALGQVKE